MNAIFHQVTCICGLYLGLVSADTKGLCSCGRSLWMQAARLDTPDSHKIAQQLNNAQANHCLCTWRHSFRVRKETLDEPMRGRLIKTVCYSICGVILENTGQLFHPQSNIWKAISNERRQQWFSAILNRDKT